MGRTLHNYDDRDDDRKTVKNKFTKPAKHTRNTPGSGMRVINKWSEESVDLDVDDDFDDNAKYFANRK